MLYMNEARKAVMFLAIISVLIDLMEGESVELDDLEDVMAMVGLDFDKIISEPPARAIQMVCREYALLNLTDEVISMIGEDDE